MMCFVGLAMISAALAERLPYLRIDEDPFKLEYESADEFDLLVLLDSAREAELQQDWPRALYLFSELHRLDRANPDHLYSMARMHFMLKQCAEALDLANQLPSGYFTRDVNMLKAGSLLCLGRYEESIDLFKGVMDQEQHLLAAKRGMTEALLALNRYEEAADVIKAMLSVDPAAIDDHPELKEALLHPGSRGPERWSHILKVYAQSKTLVSLYSPVEAATISFQHVDREKAIEILLKAIEENPDSAVLYSRLGLFYNYVGKKDLARKYMDKAFEMSPDDLDVINNSGVLAMQFGEDEKAIESFKRAVSLRPDYAEAFRNLARMFYLNEEWSDSVYAAQQALIIDAKSMNAILLAAFSSYKLGDFSNVLRYLTPVLTENMDRPSAWFLAGISAHRLGRWTEAEQYYRKGLALRKDYVLGLNNLADLLANNPKSDEGDIREALALAKRASELTNHSVKRIQDTLKEIQARSAAMGIQE